MGAPERAPFDRIIVTAAAEDIPKALVEQLGEGGKLVLPLGPRNGTQYIVKLTKMADGTLTREDLIAVQIRAAVARTGAGIVAPGPQFQLS